MTTPTQYHYEVGGIIEGEQMYASAPVGTAFQNHDSTWVKTEVGPVWIREGGTGVELDRVDRPGAWYDPRRIIRVSDTEPIPEIPTVGTVITERAQITALPIGSALMARQGYRTYRKIGTDNWVYDADDPRAPGDSFGSGSEFSLDSWNVVTRVGPLDVPSDQPVPAGLSSLADYTAAPIGTVVNYANDSGFTWTKRANGRWNPSGAGTPRSDYEMAGSFGATYRTVVTWGTAPGDSLTVTTAPAHPGIGEEIRLARDYEAMPVGSVVQWNSREDWTKFDSGRWGVVGTEGRYPNSDGTMCQPGWRVLSLPVTPLPEEVQQAIAECVTCINNVVATESNWGSVRDGAFWQLGFLPYPAIGDKTFGGAAFALPVDSLLRSGTEHQWALWRVADARGNLVRIAGLDSIGLPARETPVTVVGLAVRPEQPTYTTRSQVIRALWEKQRSLRVAHQWCSAVESALNDCGLRDPGPQDAASEPVETLLPTEGRQYDFAYTDQAATLRSLPVGSVVHGMSSRLNYLRTTEGWANCQDLSAVNQLAGVVRVEYIAGTQPPTEVPF